MNGLSVDIEKHLAGFDLRVAFEVAGAGETLALLGPSGCGKSMTLRCIAGVLRPDRGRITLGERVLFDSEEGIDLPPQQRRVGYLFQSYALFPTMTVLQNVIAGACGASRAERLARAREQIKIMRLEGLEDHLPAELSGGQQQRCAMARILANDPELICLDEPFSALDGYLRWQLELELADTLRSFSGGAVFVSHDRDEVYRLCDSVCVMSAGRCDPKRGVRELFAAPTTLAAALISGCKNVSRAELAGPGLLRCEDWGVTLTSGLACPEDVTHAGLRAHYLQARRGTVAEGPNDIPCTVDRVIDSCFSTIVMARTPGGALLRYECEKKAWDALGNPESLMLSIAPDKVMPLVDTGGREGGGAHA